MSEQPFFLDNNALTIQLGSITLRGGRPVLNGVPVEDWSVEIVRQKADELVLTFTSPSWNGARFGLSISAGLNLVKRCGWSTSTDSLLGLRPSA